MAEYVVTHKSLNLAVAGKMQEMKLGQKVSMAPAQAKKLLAKGWLTAVTTGDAVEVGEEVKEQAKAGK